MGEKEQRIVTARNGDSPWTALKGFFKLSNIKLGFIVTFKKRGEKRRAIILLTGRIHQSSLTFQIISDLNRIWADFQLNLETFAKILIK